MPSSRSRRELIADAAITTVAREGSRGLTHRAVDRAAGLAEGSTSYYFRTRDALLAATVARLAELDARLVPENPAASDDPLAGAVVELERMLAAALGPGRDRLLARYALALEGTRRPDLRVVLRRGESALQEKLAGVCARLGAPDPLRAAGDLLVLLDGVLFAAVTREDVDAATPGRDALARLLRAAAGAPAVRRRE